MEFVPSRIRGPQTNLDIILGILIANGVEQVTTKRKITIHFGVINLSSCHM